MLRKNNNKMGKVFQSPHVLYWLTFPTAIIFAFFLAHYPHVLPLNYLGVLGSFLSGLVDNYRVLLILAFWATIIAHAYEAFVARRICRKLRLDQQSTAFWMIQTFILGFPSLLLLRGYLHHHK